MADADDPPPLPGEEQGQVPAGDELSGDVPTVGVPAADAQAANGGGTEGPDASELPAPTTASAEGEGNATVPGENQGDLPQGDALPGDVPPGDAPPGDVPSENAPVQPAPQVSTDGGLAAQEPDEDGTREAGDQAAANNSSTNDALGAGDPDGDLGAKKDSGDLEAPGRSSPLSVAEGGEGNIAAEADLGSPLGVHDQIFQGAAEGEGMFPNDSVISEIPRQPQGDAEFEFRNFDDVAASGSTELLEKQLKEALARCRIIEDDRDQLERQVRELRLKADLEAQARQQAEVAREAAEEELRYRMTVQDKSDNQSHSRIAALEAMVRELQGQLEEIEEQEGVVTDLKDRVQRAERQVNDKDAHFDRIQTDLERRLAQQQQLISKNRQYMEAVGRRKLLASTTLNNALIEMRSKRKESDASVETLEALVKRLDQFMTEESSRLKEVADIKQSIASLRGKGTPNLEALEQLEIKLRQERDGAQQDFVAQRRLEDELLAHVFPRGPAPVAPGPYAPPHFGHDMGGGMWGGGQGDGGYGGAQAGYDMGHQAMGGMGMGQGFGGGGYDAQMMGYGGMQGNWGGMGGQAGHGWGGGGGVAAGAWPMAMPYRAEGGIDFDGALGHGGGGGYVGGNQNHHNQSSVHDSVVSQQDASSFAGHDISHHSHQAADLHGGSPPKLAPQRVGSSDVRLPPVGKGAANNRDKGEKLPDVPGGRGPRERRLKEGVGGPGGGAAQPPARGGRGGGGAVDRKEELKNARERELAAKAAQRRGNR